MATVVTRLAEAFHPGEMLQEKLVELGMPIKEFALRCGKPEPTIHDVLAGRSSVTPEMAVLFEGVLDIPANLWLKMQCLYDENKARRQHEAELRMGQDWAKLFPFSEMVEKGYLKAKKGCSATEKVSALLHFFGFAKTSVWKKYYQSGTLKADFPLSLAGRTDAHVLSAWFRYGENMVHRAVKTPDYSDEALKVKVPELQALANRGDGDFLPNLRELCRQAGVVFVRTPQLRESAVMGTARWVRNTPLVQVSDALCRYDVFWRIFFHQIGHILLHGKREIFLEGIDYEERLPEKESKADNYAVNCMIPKHAAELLRTFHYSEHALEAFCQNEHLHPAFVVGYLRQLKRIALSVGDQYIPVITFKQES